MTITPEILQQVAQATGAKCVAQTQMIQPLWGGYGELFRAWLQGSEHLSVIVKHIKLPQPKYHPRGWNTDRSHQRKLHSYQVETHWYRGFAGHCPEECPVPQCLYVHEEDGEILLILEDLATLGFSEVRQTASETEVQACLRWLAWFHALHLGVAPAGLWPTGTYWHLATRPDELAALEDPALKAAAQRIDQVLAQCRYQTLVHGDAKLANFCLTPDGTQVAAVDFQYVGGGCGMKDVILFLSSCIPFEQCEARVPALLDGYFAELRQAITALSETGELKLAARMQLTPATLAADVEQAWRPLYAIAWADFQRFVKGWCPDHWKINAYTEQLTRQALNQLDRFEIEPGANSAASTDPNPPMQE
ncbi:ecdysteroid 22-kinase family protein [Photobacterium atrarenae]|uniref:Ecdysteroid 22-kinase family protein n=1 Tax=Photobacterium atrarenae TaxID=865757 RepID=A0ABY5GJQ1_9GAMM|nr:ecdysteroid 22-kinase family protein [Photobacterium atrarenae]UTV29371.1 ecdysteroid 22-kinase family protein [Photobacterium atrarenae]